VSNGERYLGAAIQSAREQTLRDIEILVVENGSTDRTLDIAEWHASRDHRVRVHSIGRASGARALAHGLDCAEAPVTARLDADDLALATRLTIQLDYLDRHPDVAYVGTGMHFLTPLGHVLTPLDALEPGDRRLTLDVLASGRRYSAEPSACFRTDLARACGGFSSDFDTTMVIDYRMAAVHLCHQLPDRLYVYRRLPQSVSSAHVDYDAKQQLRASFGLAGTEHSTPPRYWHRLAGYEIAAGSTTGMLRVARELDRGGDRRGAIRLAALAGLGPLAPRYQRARSGSEPLRRDRHIEQWAREIEDRSRRPSRQGLRRSQTSAGPTASAPPHEGA
jgi:glycosyltransferase involved in cell wall biosynthesis